MMCQHECYLIGGPWIAENPRCPVHGDNAKPSEYDRECRANEIITMVGSGAMTYQEGYYAFAEIYGY